jgi:hypothetical protein
MSQKIRIQRDLDETGSEELSLEEAKRLVEASHARGAVVIDKKTGRVLKEITSDVTEIIIAELMDGG